MGFSDATKEKVRRRADQTCCWCRDRLKPIEVHHIVPEEQGGPDDEDNAAPLCDSCHRMFGGNPDLRKEIRRRRDQWYETCFKYLNPEFGWPIGLDVPCLAFSRKLSPTITIPTEGIQFTDHDPADEKKPPLLYLSVYFKRSRLFGQHIPPENEKWLYLEANMRFALNLRIQVRTLNEIDVSELMMFLTGGNDSYWPLFLQNASEDLRKQYFDRDRGWSLRGPALEDRVDSHGDNLRVWREDGENRLMISTFTPTLAGISVHARFTDDVAAALAEYLERVGFTESF